MHRFSIAHPATTSLLAFAGVCGVGTVLPRGQNGTMPPQNHGKSARERFKWCIGVVETVAWDEKGNPSAPLPGTEGLERHVSADLCIGVGRGNVRR